MTSRDKFSQSVIDALAKRAGYRCSEPTCRAATAGPSDESPLHSSNVGEACHIAAASPGGPRYDKTMTSEQRSSAENGIWMCRTHGHEIDTDKVRFPVELLREWKQIAESRAREELGRANTGAPGSAADARLARGLWHSLQGLRWELWQMLLGDHSGPQGDRVRDLRSALLQGTTPTGLMWPSEIVSALERVVSATGPSRLIGKSPLDNFKRVLASLEVETGAIAQSFSSVDQVRRFDVIQRVQFRAASARRGLDGWARSTSSVRLLRSSSDAQHSNSLFVFLEAVQEAWALCAEHGVTDKETDVL